MANPFSSFLKNNFSSSCLGVDIGTTSIKAVEVHADGKTSKVANYGLLESSGYLARANQALQTSGLKIFEADAVHLLKALIKEIGPSTTEVVASIPPFEVFTTLLDFPAMDPKEIQQALVYQARQYVPVPIEQVALDWMKVADYQDDKGFAHQKILLISVPQEEIKKYQRIFQQAGLSLRALELESLSLARLLGGDPTSSIIVDIGSRSTNIVFLERGVMAWGAQSDFASASLTQALAGSLKVNPLRAEEIKKERGILGTGPNHELATIMYPFLDAIIGEVKKARFSYEQQFLAASKPERIILAGGGANLIGIEKYFESQFGIPVVKASPFSKFTYPQEIVPFVPELNPLFSVSLGLGMKGVARS